MNKIFDTTGINWPALSEIHVSQETGILALGVLLGALAAVAFIRHFRIRLATRCLRDKMKSSAKAVRFDADGSHVFVVTASGETEIPKKPYVGGTQPAAGYEGFTPAEIRQAALRIGVLTHVVTLTQPVQRPAKEEATPRKEETFRGKDRSRPETASTSNVAVQAQKPEQPASEAVH
ncbi:MAG: hypothetical protein AAB927_02950 [Patescibacteria group bacterium]